MSKFVIETSHPFAIESKDFIVPGGAMMDFSVNSSFVFRALEIYRARPSIAWLDLGCSTGALVEFVAGTTHPADKAGMNKSRYNIVACGVEGCDYPLNRKVGAWGNPDLKDNLLCADLCSSFHIYEKDTIARFNAGFGFLLDGPKKPSFRFEIITAWEVMEHLPEDCLNTVIHNVLRHLMPDGMFAMSISSQSGYHHETVKDKKWWLDFFDVHGLVNDEQLYEKLDGTWVRGMNEPNSFNLVLRRKIFRPGTTDNKGI